MAIPVFPAVSLELHVSPSSMAPSAHVFEAWLPRPSAHTRAFQYLVDVCEAEPVAVLKLHILLLLLVVAVAVGVQL